MNHRRLRPVEMGLGEHQAPGGSRRLEPQCPGAPSCWAPWRRTWAECQHRHRWQRELGKSISHFLLLFVTYFGLAWWRHYFVRWRHNLKYIGDLEYCQRDVIDWCLRIVCQVMYLFLFHQACRLFNWRRRLEEVLERRWTPTCRSEGHCSTELRGLSSSAEHRPTQHWKVSLGVLGLFDVVYY